MWKENSSKPTSLTPIPKLCIKKFQNPISKIFILKQDTLSTKQHISGRKQDTSGLKLYIHNQYLKCFNIVR